MIGAKLSRGFPIFSRLLIPSTPMFFLLLLRFVVDDVVARVEDCTAYEVEGYSRDTTFDAYEDGQFIVIMDVWRRV